jgi:hypothetical protein
VFLKKSLFNALLLNNPFSTESPELRFCFDISPLTEVESDHLLIFIAPVKIQGYRFLLVNPMTVLGFRAEYLIL